MDTNALFKLSYGLYLLSARENGRDNACIINTAVQVAEKPNRLSIAVSKANLTHDMIVSTGRYNLSTLTQEAEFSLFQHFGMQSGREADKFADFADVARSENGLLYLTKWANAFLSVQVMETLDLGTHSLFIGELTDGEVLSAAPSCTYAYYHSDIKTRAAKPTAKKGWVCRICGYVYEGDELPEDYICPLCKHGVQDFEPLSGEEREPAEKAEAAPGSFSCICGYSYDPAAGDPDNGIAPGTPWEDVPDDWVCPICGMGKDCFEKD